MYSRKMRVATRSTQRKQGNAPASAQIESLLMGTLFNRASSRQHEAITDGIIPGNKARITAVVASAIFFHSSILLCKR
jgi:hypothetical protein